MYSEVFLVDSISYGVLTDSQVVEMDEKGNSTEHENVRMGLLSVGYDQISFSLPCCVELTMLHRGLWVIEVLLWKIRA